MTTCAWIWLYLGAFLMLLELLMPGFVIFFFGLSAVTVGLFRFAIGAGFTLSWQLAAFSVFALVYLFGLRRWVSGVFTGFSTTSRTDFGNDLIGRIGRVTEEVKPPISGRIMLGDAEWTAESDAPIAVGTDVRVVAQQNLTLKVETVS